MRSDYLGDCDAFRDLPEAINRSQFLPPRLTHDELRDAIERPPQNPQFDGPPDERGSVIKSGIDPKVVSELLAAMGSRQDQLPLIQHALMRMWSVAEGPDRVRPARITVGVMRDCGMKDSGSVAGALDQHAELIYGSLSDDSADKPPRRRSTGEPPPTRRQQIARRMFCALCQQGGDGRRVRRVCKMGEIAAVAGKDVTVEEVIAVAAEFTQSGRNFLVATPPAELTAESDLDISHESLIRNWQRLGHWLDAEEESAARYRRLRETVRLKSWIGGAELVDVWRWRRTEKPTPAWAKRYGAQFKECMDLIRKSFIRSVIVLATILSLLVVGPLFVVNNFKNKQLKSTNTELESTITELKMQREATRLAEIEKNIAERDKKAAQLLASIGGGTDYPTSAEFAAYDELAGEPDELRLSFFKQLLLAKEERYRTQYAFALHAVVGLDTDTRDKVRTMLLENGRPPNSEQPSLNIACAMLGSLLEIHDDPHLRGMIAANLDAALEKTTDPKSVAELLRRPVEMNGPLSETQTKRLLDAFAAALTGAVETEKTSPLVAEISALKEADPEFDKTAANLSKALESVRKSISSGELNQQPQQQTQQAVQSALQSISLDELKQQTQQAVQSVLQESNGASDVREQWLSLYNRFANRVAISSNFGQARPEDWNASLSGFIASLNQAIETPDSQADFPALKSLVQVVASLDGQLPGEQGSAVAQQILAVMEQTINPYDLSSLGDALGSLSEKLPGEHALGAARQIVAAMQQTTDSGDLSALGHGLGSLDEKLPSEQAVAAAHQIMAAMEQATDPVALSSLGTALGSLSEELPGEQALVAFQKIVAAMEKTTDADALRSLGEALEVLVPRMASKDTTSVLKATVCVGDTRQKVLTGLEKKAKQKFNSNLWKAVKWLKSEGVDVKNVPRFPIRSPE